MKLSPRTLLTGIPLLLFAGLLAAGLSDEGILHDLFGYGSFYLTAGMVLLWGYHLAVFVRRLGVSMASMVRAYGGGILAALALSVLVFASVPVKFKVLGDETNLLAVSQSMLSSRTVFRISMGVSENGRFTVLKRDVPNRPLLFPFAVYLVHAAAGFRPENAFAVNFLTLFIFLSGIFVLLKKNFGRTTGLAGMFLALGNPVVSIHAASGGYDLFSTVFFALALWLFHRYISSPEPDTFAFLWMTLLMFSNIRYESFLFFGVLVAAAVCFARRNPFAGHPHVYALTPLLSLPYIWQRLLTRGTYENPVGGPLFSIEYFFENVRVFISNMLNLNFYLPYNGLLNAIAVVILPYLAAVLIRRKCRPGLRLTYSLCVAAGCAGLMMVIVLSHHLGSYDRPTQARLFLWISLFFAAAPLLLKAVCPQTVSGGRLLVLAVTAFLLYHPVATGHRFMDDALIGPIHTEIRDFLDSSGGRDCLLVTAYPGHYAAMRYGAVGFDFARTNLDALKRALGTHRFSGIVFAREIKYPGQGFSGRLAWVPEAFALESAKTVRIWKDHYLELLRVKQ